MNVWLYYVIYSLHFGTAFFVFFVFLFFFLFFFLKRWKRFRFGYFMLLFYFVAFRQVLVITNAFSFLSSCTYCHQLF